MKFSEFSEYLEKLEKTASRLTITSILADLFKKTSQDEIAEVIYLSLGFLAPSYKGIVFNIADKMMIKAIALAFEVDDQAVLQKYKQLGDIGATAEAYSPKRVAQLSVHEVYQALYKVAVDEGEGSQERKIVGIADIFNKLDPLSSRYLARIPVGNLRLGFSDKTVIDALSLMVKGDKSAKKQIEKAYEVVPDVGKLAYLIKSEGLEKATKNVKPVVGIPVVPMLAQRLKSPDEMIKKMGQVAIEPKFDGLRVQIHFRKNKPVKAFTRNLNDISDMFPELNLIGQYLTVDSAVLDSEAVGVDAETLKLADFQTTMNRRRKHNIEASAKKTPLTFQIFDAMLLGDRSLMAESYVERRKALLTVFKKNKIFIIDDYRLTENPDEIRSKHKELLKQGLEGVIVKKADSEYIPGRTGWRWVKMKEVEESDGKLADNVDAIIMGYTQGKGKRALFGIGQFLAGVRDGEKVKSITKVGTGLSDEQFMELSKRLAKIVSPQMPNEYEVHKDLEPDYWVKPEVIVELAADEITKSPKHTAGWALRFPRLIKFRDDKSMNEATTLKELKKLHELQKR